MINPRHSKMGKKEVIKEVIKEGLKQNGGCGNSKGDHGPRMHPLQEASRALVPVHLLRAWLAMGLHAPISTNWDEVRQSVNATRTKRILPALGRKLRICF
jgi:hypothetical protein